MSRSSTPSPRQAKILDFIQTFAQRHGYCPTYGEMEDGTGIGRATLHREVKHLEVLRLVRRDEHRVRALRLTHPTPKTLVTLLTEYDVVDLVRERHGAAAAERLAEALAAAAR